MSYVVSKYKLPKRIEDNIMLCFFKLAVYAGLAVYNLIDGLMDEFEDETGVDVAGSTNESYDAANDLYQPAESSSDIISQILNQTSNILGDASNTDIDLAQTFTLDSIATIVGIKVTFNANTGNPLGNATYRIETVDGSNKPSGILADANLTLTQAITASAENIVTFATPATLAAGMYALVILVPDQETNVHWNVGSSSGDSAYGGGTGYEQYNGDGVWNALGNDMTFKITKRIFLNMTLISNAVAAEAVPVKSRIVLFEEDVNAITVNTDIKAYVSRDGGTTYTQHTLVDEGDYETGKRILSSEAVAISAQPSGQSMKWKVESLNNKDLKLHAVGVSWD